MKPNVGLYNALISDANRMVCQSMGALIMVKTGTNTSKRIVQLRYVKPNGCTDNL